MEASGLCLAFVCLSRRSAIESGIKVLLLCVFLPVQWELLWSLILLLTFCLLLVWFYFWWEAHNDYSEFNW